MPPIDTWPGARRADDVVTCGHVGSALREAGRSAATMISRQIHLLRRPQGIPDPSDFALVTVDVPPIEPGQVLIENLWMSVEPYMRRCMELSTEDQVPWPLNGPLNGPSVGRVIDSRHPRFQVGDLVESLSGWQSHFVSDGADFVPFASPFTALAKRCVDRERARDCLGILGLASFTAYIGMTILNPCRAGNTVVISSGAGTVGSIACQIAKQRGLRVVSSAGSDEKVRWLLESIGVDEAFNYRRRSIDESLAQRCPDGIDLVLENASPEHLSACLPLMKDLGTILISGLIGIYSTGGKIPHLPHFEYVLDRFLHIRAYRYMDFWSHYDAFVSDMTAWRERGQVTLREELFDGLEAAPEALCALLSGGCWGKPLIRLSRDA